MKRSLIVFGITGMLGLATLGWTTGRSSNVKATEAESETKTLILDGSKLTSTATETDTTLSFDNFDFVFSKGAKKQALSGSKGFSKNEAILIGKAGTYIYNTKPIGKRITKFEIYSNGGASTKVSIGVTFGSSKLTKYDSTTAFATVLLKKDSVYDASSKLSDDTQYFWYQVTNSNNSQVQFRITYEEGEVVKPSSVSVSLDKNELLEIGSTAQATATVLPEDATNKAVVWSSSDEAVAIVNKDTGLVTATGKGTADIIATCVADSAITGKESITINVIKTKIEEDVYLTADSLKLTGNSYADNNKSHIFSGNSYTTNQVMLQQGAMQFKANDGFLINDQSFFSSIKSIGINVVSGTLNISAGQTKDNLETQNSDSSNDIYTCKFDKSDGVKFFKIAAGSKLLKIDFIVIELYDEDMANIRDFAELFNQEMEEACSAMKGINKDDWITLSELYGELSDDQKTILVNSNCNYIYTEISKCVQRYDYIVSKYSNLDNFMNRDVQTNKASMIIEPGSGKSTIALATLLVTFTISSVGLFFFLKKRKEA